MIGQTLSHYRITAALGAGGMGEVYRATDTKLGRDVAIKVLPAEVSQDPDRLARFEREAHLLAALNHPNVAAIYGLEEAEGNPFLVLELVEGEELQQRLEGGAIPMDEAIDIARQIAEGLEAAHDKGVVHRDLKPANVKLTPDGKVKVLDFGLAKAWGGDPVTGSSSDLSQSPTLAHTGTRAGVILGTAAYMSPEQASGRAVDRRADVWSFGVVLFEMLTGERLFTGDTVSDVRAAVLRDDPDWSKLPDSSPASLRKLLRRCLQKAPRERLHDIADARLELEDPDSGATDTGGAAAQRRSGPGTVVAAVAGGLALFVAGWLVKPAADPGPTLVRKVDLAVTDLIAHQSAPPTISPDGTQILYRSGDSLWVRRLDQLEPLKLAGTGGASLFFWSPDSARIGYVADAQLWKVSAGGGQPSAIASVPGDFDASGGGAWSEDGRIVLAGSSTVGLLEIPEQGGDGRALLELDLAREVDFHEICALPDGRGLVFTVHRVTGWDAIALFTGDSRRVILALEGESLRSPVYSHSGHILYTRESTNPGIWALPFSLERLEATGEPFLVASRAALPSVSSDGTLAYVREGLTPPWLVWVDRKGLVEPLAEITQASYVGWRPQLSPDASRVILYAIRDGNGDVWSYDISRGAMTRLTVDAREDHSPVWFADGERFVFTSQRAGRAYNLYSRRADGSGEAERLTDEKAYGTPVATSRDGRWLFFNRRGQGEGKREVWRLRLDGAAAAEPLLASPHFSHYDVAPSSDGLWLAYTSDESGQAEVYVQSLPDLGGKQQVSTQGGHQVEWSRDGRELFFSEGTRLMVAGVTLGDDALRLTRPRELFALDDDSRIIVHGEEAPDGRFLMSRKGEGATITLVLNWFRELKAMGRKVEE